MLEPWKSSAQPTPHRIRRRLRHSQVSKSSTTKNGLRPSKSQPPLSCVPISTVSTGGSWLPPRRSCLLSPRPPLSGDPSLPQQCLPQDHREGQAPTPEILETLAYWRSLRRNHSDPTKHVERGLHRAAFRAMQGIPSPFRPRP